MNTEYGHERIMTTNTDSPRLAVTPGEWYASEMLTMMTTDLRQLNGFTEMIDAIDNCRTVGVSLRSILPRLTVARLN